jgi:hypothetical protein
MDLILFYIDFIVMTYSLYLRQRVMDFVASGGGKTEALRAYVAENDDAYL